MSLVSSSVLFSKKFVVAAAALTVAGAALAQADYPNKPIRVVIPFPPGGAIDTFVRTVGPDVSAYLGQQVVVVNKPGGGSQIAAADVKSSPPDGYTVFFGQTGDFSVNPLLYKNINYVPARDFDGVAMLVRAPQVMLANTTGKINSVESLKTELASSSTRITYGSMGPGTAPHLLGHMLSKEGAVAEMTHVPYKGFQPAVQAIYTKEIDLLFDAVPGTMNMMKSGKVVPLAVAAAQRSPYLPNVPTTSELGMPNLQMNFWIGMAVKKGTPRPIIDKLHTAFEKAVAKPENAKRFSEWGYELVNMTPEAFDAHIREETEKMKPIVIGSGVSID